MNRQTARRSVRSALNISPQSNNSSNVSSSISGSSGQNSISQTSAQMRDELVEDSSGSEESDHRYSRFGARSHPFESRISRYDLSSDSLSSSSPSASSSQHGSQIAVNSSAAVVPVMNAHIEANQEIVNASTAVNQSNGIVDEDDDDDIIIVSERIVVNPVPSELRNEILIGSSPVSPSPNKKRKANDESATKSTQLPTESRISVECTICMEESRNISCGICGHAFCTKCLTEWVRREHKCPLCRRKLTMKQIHRVYL